MLCTDCQVPETPAALPQRFTQEPGLPSFRFGSMMLIVCPENCSRILPGRGHFGEGEEMASWIADADFPCAVESLAFRHIDIRGLQSGLERVEIFNLDVQECWSFANGGGDG